jgi:hypothetical protein
MQPLFMASVIILQPALSQVDTLAPPGKQARNVVLPMYE